jgi:hypothetical protein
MQASNLTYQAPKAGMDLANAWLNPLVHLV